MGTSTDKLRLHQGFRVYDTLRQPIEKLVCFRFLIESSLQKFRSFILAKQMSEGANTSITGDLVMFDFLRRNNNASVNHRSVTFLLQDFRSFLNKPFHSTACLSLRLFIQPFEDLLESFHMTLGLFEMLFKGIFELLR